MNLSLSLKPEDLKKLLPILRAAQPYIVGLVLIGIFAYTAVFVNAVMNVQPAASSPSSKDQAITFDKTTINALKQLQPVTGEVPKGSLGQSSPF